MHDNSVSAFRSLNVSDRAATVLRVYVDSLAPLTDREVMRRLGFTDGNAVKPRISELVDAGLLEEHGDTIDAETHKRVRLCRPAGKALVMRPTSMDAAATAARMHDRKSLALYIANQGARGATKSELARQLPTITPKSLPDRIGELLAFDIITREAGEIRGGEPVWLITEHGAAKLELPADAWCVKKGVPCH